MIVISEPSLNRVAYVFALALSGGTLATYLLGALVSRYLFRSHGRSAKEFNLGVPTTVSSESTFALSLAAAQTTLSTVFVAFLTDAGFFGWHLLYCPIAFAAGNWLMLRVHEKLEKLGYVNESSLSGLIPYYIYRFTGSRPIAAIFVLVCVLPLLAILSLELMYGIRILDYLGGNALASSAAIPAQGPNAILATFGLFIIFAILLFGYVFVGGFRAVVASDIWQGRIMLTTFSLVLVSVLAECITLRHSLHFERLQGIHRGNLLMFYVAITLINLFEPLSFATTWQRFRAFRGYSVNFSVAVKRATLMVAYMWTALILIGIGLQLIAVVPLVKGDVASLLTSVIGINMWFQLFVFPLLVIAGLSGMYSSSDTCVSSLLYLTETSNVWQKRQLEGELPLKRRYYFFMLLLFCAALGMYFVVNRTSVDPISIAMELFANAIVLAPTVLLLVTCASDTTTEVQKLRSYYVLASVAGGLTAYWSFDLWTKQQLLGWSIVVGLVASSLPASKLYLLERRKKAGFIAEVEIHD